MKSKSVDFLNISSLAPFLPFGEVSEHWGGLGVVIQKRGISDKCSDNIGINVGCWAAVLDVASTISSINTGWDTERG